MFNKPSLKYQKPSKICSIKNKSEAQITWHENYFIYLTSIRHNLCLLIVISSSYHLLLLIPKKRINLSSSLTKSESKWLHILENYCRYHSSVFLHPFPNILIYLALKHIQSHIPSLTCVPYSLLPHPTSSLHSFPCSLSAYVLVCLYV